MKTIYSLLLFICSILIAFSSFSGGSSSGVVPPPAGLPPCAVNPAPGESACTATPICNPHGFCGTTSASYAVDTWSQLTSAFNCGSIENNSFLSFTAESSSISFDAYVYNCYSNEAIQIFIFSAANCGSGPVTSFICMQRMYASNTPYNITANGLIPGNQYYIMIDGYAGEVCDYTFVATDGVAMPVSLSSGDAVTICAGETITTTATGGNGVYTWDPSPDLSSTTDATVTITPPTTPGNYVYEVHSAGGVPNCPSTVDYTLTVTVEICCSIETSVASVVCNTAAGTYTANIEVDYQYPPSTGNLVVTGPGGFTQTVPYPYGSSPYTVSVPNVSLSNPTSTFSAYFTGSTSCSHVLNYNAPITPTFNPISVCQGGTAPILPSASIEGITGTWSPATVSTSATANYTFSPDNGQCPATLTVTVNPLPTITTNSPVTLDCTNPAGVQLTASSPVAGATFGWTDDLGGSAGIVSGANTNTLTVNSTGSYIVTATNPATGCENTATVVVNGNGSEPALSIDPNFTDITCYNYTTTLTGIASNGSGSSGSASDLTYQWSTNDGSFISGTTTPSTDIDGAGVYTVTVTDNSNGCMTSESVIVGGNLVPPVIAPITAPVISCNDSTVVLTGNSDVTNATYAWTTTNGNIISTTNENALVGLAGTYVFTATNPVNGCSSTQNVVVTGNTTLPNVEAGPNLVVCTDSMVVLQGSSTTPGVTYSWDATDGNAWLVGFSNIPNPEVPSPAWFYLHVTDTINNCTATDSVEVTAHILPVLFNDTTLCGPSFQVPTGSVTVGGAFTWSELNNGGTFSSTTSLTPTFTPTTPSVVNYTLILTDACTSDSVNVTIIPLPTSSSPSALCDDPKNLISSSYTSGTWTGSGVTFTPSATTAGGLTPVTTTATANPGTYTVTFTNTQCNYTQNYTLVYPVDVVLFNDTTVCATSFQVPNGVVGSGSGTWSSLPVGAGSFNNPSSLTPIFTPTTGTIQYTLSYNDVCDTASVVVTFPPQPVVSTPPAYSCDDMSEIITSISYGGGTWTVTDNPATAWHEDTALVFNPSNLTNGGMITESILVSSHPTAGVYNLTFTDSTCGYSSSITLNFLPYPWTQVNDTSVCAGVEFSLAAWQGPNNQYYNWNNGQTGPSIIVTQPGTYIVEASNDCYTYSDTATVIHEICDIEAPNVISLNSKEGNNLWFVNSNGITDFNCIIVNRWGNLIYEYNDVNGSWDGRDMGGNIVSEGVYFYSIEATYESGEKVKKHGFIHVVQ